MQQWYKCPNCGAPVAFGVRFCGNCGTQLNWPTQQTQPPPVYQQQRPPFKHNLNKKIGIPLGIIVAVALVICLAPLKEVAYSVTVDYEDVETYYEDEPYQVTETYTDAAPLSFEAKDYVKADTIKERRQIVIGGTVLQDEVVEVPIETACVDVRNTDDIAGTFTVSFSGITPMFGSPSLTTKIDLSPDEVKTATCPADNIADWSYSVTPSTKMVEKQRDVTKYRQVEKQRTVIKQCPETRYKKVTLLDYLLHY